MMVAYCAVIQTALSGRPRQLYTSSDNRKWLFSLQACLRYSFKAERTASSQSAVSLYMADNPDQPAVAIDTNQM